MPVLVAYASRRGSAQGIAERIAVVLRAGELEVDLGLPKAWVTRQAMTLSSSVARCMPPGGWPRCRSSSGHLLRLFLPQGGFRDWPRRGLGHLHRQRTAADPAAASALTCPDRSGPLLEEL
jgi:hypothetical protein